MIYHPFKFIKEGDIVIDGMYLEEWRPISLDNIKHNMYIISTFGRIQNINTHIILKQNIINSGYCTVALSTGLPKNNRLKRFLVHRLVAQVFVYNPDPINNTTVNHIDGNKTNNMSWNLEWTTQLENNNHAKIHNLNQNYGCMHYKSKLSESQIIHICEMLSKGYTYSDIIKSIGLNSSDQNNYDLIGNIYRGITYKNFSRNYTFPIRSHSYGSTYSDDEIRRMCQMIKNNIPVNDAYYIITGNQYINSHVHKQFYECYRKIKNKTIFQNILNDIS